MDIKEAVKDLTQGLAQDVADVLAGEGWHMPGDCMHDDCADSAVVAELGAAIRALHTQAHNGPQDSLEVENCHVEPCKSVRL